MTEAVNQILKPSPVHKHSELNIYYRKVQAKPTLAYEREAQII